MRSITIGLCGIVIVAMCGVAFGQRERENRGKAPTDKAAYFSITGLKSDFKKMADKNVSNSIGLMDGGHFSLNIVHRQGKEDPQWHQDEVDLYIIQEGTATMLTGGELLDPQPSGTNGDKRGSSIKGGVSQVVKPGDVVFIPPGVPHQGIFNDPKGVTYLNIHFPGRK